MESYITRDLVKISGRTKVLLKGIKGGGGGGGIKAWLRKSSKSPLLMVVVELRDKPQKISAGHEIALLNCALVYLRFDEDMI